MSDITKRLRCQYPLGQILENGEPEFGWRDFSGGVAIDLPTPLMIEAAETIDALFMQRDELLAALKQAEGFVEHAKMSSFGDDFDSPTLEIIRKAIAKAEGKL